jgi:hypothetical protein
MEEQKFFGRDFSEHYLILQHFLERKVGNA